MKRVLAVALAATAAGAALAQTDAPRNPSDAAIAVPKVEYRSAFSDYRPYADQEPAPWRALNDEMGRLGGHRGHIAGADKGAPKKSQKPAAKPPAPEGHGAHK